MAKRLLVNMGYGMGMFPEGTNMTVIIELLDSIQRVERVHDANYKTYYKPDEREGQDPMFSYELVDDTHMKVDDDFYEKKAKAMEKERDEARNQRWDMEKTLKELQAKIATMEETISMAHNGCRENADMNETRASIN